MSTTLNMSESFIDWLTFENCEYSNHSHNETSNLAKNQQLTAHVELIGTCVTVVVVLAFFVVALFQCRQKAQEGQGPGGLLLTWDTSQRTMSFAFLLLLNAASFFISVDSDFRAWNQTRMQCTAQGVLYQFSFCGLMLETLALTVQVYMVLVKTVPLPKLYSWQFALPTFAAVYGVAAFLALVPLAIQLSLDVPVYHGGDKLGYCNLSFDTGCQAAFFLFWVAPALIILVTCLAMNVVVFRRILPVYRHMRSTVKNTLLLFITRRVIVLVLQVRACVHACFRRAELLLLLLRPLEFAVNALWDASCAGRGAANPFETLASCVHAFSHACIHAYIQT